MPSIAYVHRFITSMAFTMIVETAMLFIVVRLVAKEKGIATWRIIATGFLASYATIPYVWFVIPRVVEWERETSLLVSEPLIFLIEIAIYRLVLGIQWRHAVLASLVGNLASYLLGPFLRGQGLWIYW